MEFSSQKTSPKTKIGIVSPTTPKLQQLPSTNDLPNSSHIATVSTSDVSHQQSSPFSPTLKKKSSSSITNTDREKDVETKKEERSSKKKKEKEKEKRKNSRSPINESAAGKKKRPCEIFGKSKTAVPTSISKSLLTPEKHHQDQQQQHIHSPRQRSSNSSLSSDSAVSIGKPPQFVGVEGSADDESNGRSRISIPIEKSDSCNSLLAIKTNTTPITKEIKKNAETSRVRLISATQSSQEPKQKHYMVTPEDDIGYSNAHIFTRFYQGQKVFNFDYNVCEFHAILFFKREEGTLLF